MANLTLPGRILAAILIALAVVTAPAADARTVKGEKSFGPAIGYVSRNNSVTGGIAFNYSFSSVGRVAPELGIIFRHKDLDGLNACVNVHFPVGTAGSRFAFYPLVGLNFTSWSLHNVDSESGDDVTTHRNIFGLNAGAGVELRCSGALKLTLEARYTLMRHYPTAFVTAGIAFVF